MLFSVVLQNTRYFNFILRILTYNPFFRVEHEHKENLKKLKRNFAKNTNKEDIKWQNYPFTLFLKFKFLSPRCI